jgi:cellulose biosynthesis protein BcsQ
MFITFYSYKGGVGRSLALANIACLMAEDPDYPQRVLLWDFDLEAPGLHRLFPSASRTENSGYLDLVYEYATTGLVPDVQRFIYKSQINNIDVLGAGIVGKDYCARLESIDWPQLFGDDPLEGEGFFSKLLGKISSLNYDYVLIDSRTGFNDLASICTQVLSDVIVLIFRLTSQNLDGLEYLVPALRGQLKQRGKDEIAIIPVASQVPSYSPQLVEQRDAALRIFGEKRLRHIRFDPDLVSDEALYSKKAEKSSRWPLPSVIQDYEGLCDFLRQKNESDTRTATSILTDKMRTDDTAAAIPVLEQLLPRVPRLPRIWRYLERICDHVPQLRERFNVIINQIIANEPVAFAYDWIALDLAVRAEDIDSPLLYQAIDNVEIALSLPNGRNAQRLRKLSRLTSCVGDIERAIENLKAAAEIGYRHHREETERHFVNTQVVFDLADLHMRRGKAFFGAAIEELCSLPDDEAVQSRAQILALLYSSIRDTAKSEECLHNFETAATDKADVRTTRAYALLLQGRREDAKRLASTVGGANWREFLICLGEADEVIKEKRVPGDESKYPEPLTALARYLVDETVSEEVVLGSWKNRPSQFRELLIVREYLLEEGCPYKQERIAIIEKLVRQDELESKLKGQRKFASLTKV